MRLAGLALFLGLALVATPSLGDKRLFQAKFVFVDGQDRQTAAVGLDIACEETGSSGTTDARGLFNVHLPGILMPGDRIRLRVQGTTWRIWQPPGGELAIPASAYEKKVVTVKLLEVGAKRLLNLAAIELLLLDAARKSKEQVKAGGRPAEIQLSVYLGEWAVRYGFAAEEVKAEVDRWIAKAEVRGDDPRRLALAAFARNDFDRASELAAQWAASDNRKLRALEEGKRRPRADAVQAYRLAGDARYNDYRFENALEFYRKALVALSRKPSPTTWAAIQDDVGRAARELGIRAQDEAAGRYLDESIEAHRAALRVRTRALPQQWAQSQSGLGLALQERGSRTRGEAGLALLAQATEAYRAALEVYTRARTPQQWAMIQNNLGSVLQELGNRSPGEAGLALLAQAVEAYRTALEVHTRQRTPQQFATIENKLGTALQDQANRSPGEAGLTLLVQAVEAYRTALEVYTRERAPQQFAMIQNNLGTALEEQGDRSPDDVGRALRAQAAEAYDAAAEVATQTTPWILQHHTDSSAPTAGF